MDEVAKGPFILENWLDSLKGIDSDATYEQPLFTDARITGEVDTGFGPYQLINGRAFAEIGVLRPGILLRVENFSVEPVMHDEPWKTDVTRYHAGSLADEISALISLSLGIRVKAGETSRIFLPNGDPKGTPRLSSHKSVPVLLLNSECIILPWTRRQVCINDLDLLLRFIELSPADATALVLAARSYQNGLWNAESDPELAWLQFVSAIEIVAQQWDKSVEEPLVKLERSKPELYDVLMSKGQEFAHDVASLIVPTMGATSKFVRFLMLHLPSPPHQRPPSFIQFEWTSSNLKKAFTKIYDHRSRALHAGSAFPLPMCERPFEDKGSYAEVPLGLATRGGGGTWLREDTPMLLHFFEFLVRNALQNWWRSLLPNSSS